MTVAAILQGQAEIERLREEVIRFTRCASIDAAILGVAEIDRLRRELAEAREQVEFYRTSAMAANRDLAELKEELADARLDRDEAQAMMDRALRAQLEAQPSQPDGDVLRICADLRACAMAWEPMACLLGNVRAGDIVRLCDSFAAIPPAAPAAIVLDRDTLTAHVFAADADKRAWLKSRPGEECFIQRYCEADYIEHHPAATGESGEALRPCGCIGGCRLVISMGHRQASGLRPGEYCEIKGESGEAAS
jgi:hypothetical protein